MLQDIHLTIGIMSDKYNLPEDDVRTIVEETIGETLSKVFRYEVTCKLDETEGLKLWGYVDTNGDFKAREVNINDLKKNIVRLIKYNVVENLHKRNIFKEHDRLNGLIGSVVNGIVIHNGEEDIQTIYCELEGVSTDEGAAMTAFCTLKEQPVRERGHYFRGQMLQFFILRVEPIYDHGVPKLAIALSRRSKTMVEVLLSRECPEAKIECTRRIAGAISEVRTDRRLPREAIKKVSDELAERIKVTWVDPIALALQGGGGHF